MSNIENNKIIHCPECSSKILFHSKMSAFICKNEKCNFYIDTAFLISGEDDVIFNKKLKLQRSYLREKLEVLKEKLEFYEQHLSAVEEQLTSQYNEAVEIKLFLRNLAFFQRKLFCKEVDSSFDGDIPSEAEYHYALGRIRTIQTKNKSTDTGKLLYLKKTENF